MGNPIIILKTPVNDVNELEVIICDGKIKYIKSMCVNFFCYTFPFQVNMAPYLFFYKRHLTKADMKVFPYLKGEDAKNIGN